MTVTYVCTANVPVDQLTPYPGNARRGDVARIQESIKRHGQYRALVVQELDDGATRIILAGNHTHAALKAEGYATARCEIIHCTPDEAARINLADNRMAELGDYDTEALIAILENLGGDYDGTGYTQDDLDDLIGIIDTDPDTDLDDIPEHVPNITQPGDLWQLGNHRILCADATNITAVDQLMEGHRADCMWTDPPYGVNYVGKTKDALIIQNDGAENLEELLHGFLATATTALQPGAPAYIAHPPGALSLIFGQAIIQAGWSLRQSLIWVKDTFAMGRSDYHYRHEPIWLAYTPGGEGRRGRGGDHWYGDNAQDTVFEIPKPSRSAEHPTMKPIELITATLRNSCTKDGIVYEPFAGSGSTLIAAEVLGMHTRALELDPKYVDVTCRRWQNLTGELPQRSTENGTTESVDFHTELVNR